MIRKEAEQIVIIVVKEKKIKKDNISIFEPYISPNNDKKKTVNNENKKDIL